MGRRALMSGLLLAGLRDAKDKVDTILPLSNYDSADPEDLWAFMTLAGPGLRQYTGEYKNEE